MTPQETDSDLLVSVQESVAEVWVSGGLLQGWGHCMGTFEGGLHYLRYLHHSLASLVAQMVKRLLAMWEIWVRSLGGEDPLEKGMANHSSVLDWKIPQTVEPGGLQSTGSQRDTTEVT